MCADEKVLEGGVGVDVGGFEVVHIDVKEVDEGFDLAFGAWCCFSFACTHKVRGSSSGYMQDRGEGGPLSMFLL